MSGFIERLALRAAGLSAADGPALLAPRPHARFGTDGGAAPGANGAPFEIAAETVASPAQSLAPMEPGLPDAAAPAGTARSDADDAVAPRALPASESPRARPAPSLPRAVSVAVPVPRSARRVVRPDGSAVAQSPPAPQTVVPAPDASRPAPAATAPVHGRAPNARPIETSSGPPARAAPVATETAVPSARAKPPLPAPRRAIAEPLPAPGAPPRHRDRAPAVTVSIGRIEVEIAPPPAPVAPPSARSQPVRTRGFESYALARRGRVR